MNRSVLSFPVMVLPFVTCPVQAVAAEVSQLAGAQGGSGRYVTTLAPAGIDLTHCHAGLEVELIGPASALQKITTKNVYVGSGVCNFALAPNPQAFDVTGSSIQRNGIVTSEATAPNGHELTLT